MNKFEEICFKSCEDWVSSFSEDDDFEFSNAFENSIECIAGEMEKNKTYKLPRKIIKILIIAAIILSFVTTAFAIPNTRNYIIKQFKDHFSYIVADICEINKTDDISIEYLPESFKKTKQEISDIGILNEFYNGNMWFTIFKNTIDTVVNYDNSQQETVRIDNIEYIVVHMENADSIIWNNGIYNYHLTGNINEEILLKIA